MTRHVLIVLSDLHVSAVRRRPEGSCVVHDGFHYDAAFSSFVDDLIARAAGTDAKCELLLLGDVFDFLHTKVPLTTADLLTTTEAASLQKLEAMIGAHPALFAALKRLSMAGFQLSIVPGNHDIDLVRPAVQEVFGQAVQSGSNGNVHFYPWIYYIPGVLYAEHGHQYHDISAHTTLLRPFRGGDSWELELPPSAYFDIYLFDLVERLRRPGDQIVAPLRYLLLHFVKQPLHLLGALPQIAKFVYTALGALLYRNSHQFRAARRRYRDEIISRYASSTGLQYSTCLALDELAELSNRRFAARLLHQAVFRKKRGPASAYLHSKALAISNVLSSHDKTVPFYLFGHSHHAGKVPLEGQPDRFFLNSGSWSSPTYPGSSGDRTLFPFVEIAWGNDQLPSAVLMQWDEARHTTVQVEGH